MEFVTFLDAVTAGIQDHFDALKSCQPHPGRFDLTELRQWATQLPAVRVAVLGVRQVELESSGMLDVTLRMAAFVATSNRVGQGRDIGALGLVGGLVLLLRDTRWNQANVFEPTNVTAENLYTASVRQSGGIALWGVSWNQVVRIGEEALWGEEMPLPEELYVSCEPLTGPDHIDAYELVEGTPSGD